MLLGPMVIDGITRGSPFDPNGSAPLVTTLRVGIEPPPSESRGTLVDPVNVPLARENSGTCDREEGLGSRALL